MVHPGPDIELIRAIKEDTDLAITLSVGERPYADYLAWKEAGATATF